MMRFLSVLLITWFVSDQGFSQWASSKQWDTWRLDNGVEADLSTTPPSFTTTSTGISNAGRLGLICDSLTGQLLIYTNGDTIWNRNHQPMPNGTGILGGSMAHQQAIIPYPGWDRHYIVFTPEGDFGANGCWYSVVDLDGDGGLGDVMPSLKNISLNGQVNNRVTVAPHSNGRDYWVILRASGSNDYHVQLIDENGPDTNSTIYTVGSINWGGRYAFSYMNHDNTRVITMQRQLNRIEIFPFDATTGQIGTVEISISNVDGIMHSCQFSPDGSKLYVTYMQGLDPGSQGYLPLLEQYDLSSGDSTIIKQTKTVLDSVVVNGLKLFSNAVLVRSGKILFHRGNISNDVAAIHNPNLPGLACGYDPQYVSNVTITNFPNIYWSKKMLTTGLQNPSLEYSNSVLYPNPASNQVYLNSTAQLGVVEQLCVYDVNGRAVHTAKKRTPMGAQLFDVSSLESGTYIVQLSSATGTRTVRLMVE